MKKIMVLGGSGFVGSQLCEKLVRQGWLVTVPTRRRTNASHLLHLPGLTVLEFDVHNEGDLTAALPGHDAVVNLVAILHGTQAAFDKAHVALPEKIARFALASGVAHVVQISALGAQGEQPSSPSSMYLRSKSRGEAALMRSAPATPDAGFSLTILRPSVIFGAGDKFLNLFARLQQIAPFVPLAGADALFQPVWVQDVALAVVRCLAQSRSPGGQPPLVLELCGPEVYTLKQLVQLAGQLSGVRQGRGRPVFGLPDWLAWPQAALMELLPGEPLMSRDNLASMRTPNVAGGKLPGLALLGISPAALPPLAAVYLTQNQPHQGMQGLRQRASRRR